MDKSYRKEYSEYIIQNSTISNYSSKNLHDIVLDTAENLTQIGLWTLNCFNKEQNRIKLFLSLTRKNMNALHGFPLAREFNRDFEEFYGIYDKLEKENDTGIVNKTVWGNLMLKWGTSFSLSSKSI